MENMWLLKGMIILSLKKKSCKCLVSPLCCTAHISPGVQFILGLLHITTDSWHGSHVSFLQNSEEKVVWAWGSWWITAVKGKRSLITVDWDAHWLKSWSVLNWYPIYSPQRTSGSQNESEGSHMLLGFREDWTQELSAVWLSLGGGQGGVWWGREGRKQCPGNCWALSLFNFVS